MPIEDPDDENGGRPGFRLIFRPWRIDPRTGRKLWAKHHGKKAWPMWVPVDRKPQ